MTPESDCAEPDERHIVAAAGLAVELHHRNSLLVRRLDRRHRSVEARGLESEAIHALRQHALDVVQFLVGVVYRIGFDAGDVERLAGVFGRLLQRRDIGKGEVLVGDADGHLLLRPESARVCQCGARNQHR